MANELLAGSITGALSFRVIALRTEKLALAHKDPVRSLRFGSVIFRMGVLGVTLWGVYHLDTSANPG